MSDVLKTVMDKVNGLLWLYGAWSKESRTADLNPRDGRSGGNSRAGRALPPIGNANGGPLQGIAMRKEMAPVPPAY